MYSYFSTQFLYDYNVEKNRGNDFAKKDLKDFDDSQLI